MKKPHRTIAELIKHRAAHQSDRDQLQSLLTQSWLDFWAPHLPPDAEERFRELDPVAHFLNAHLKRLEIADLNGPIVGAIFVEAGRLEDLHVAAEKQGLGIGRRLLERAVVRGARRLEVRAFNERAIGFYEQAGWRKSRTYWTTEMGFPVQSHEYVVP